MLLLCWLSIVDARGVIRVRLLFCDCTIRDEAKVPSFSKRQCFVWYFLVFLFFRKRTKRKAEVERSAGGFGSASRCPNPHSALSHVHPVRDLLLLPISRPLFFLGVLSPRECEVAVASPSGENAHWRLRPLSPRKEKRNSLLAMSYLTPLSSLLPSQFQTLSKPIFPV